jgi:hypothetical protein
MKKQFLLTLSGAALLWAGSASCVSAQDSQASYTPPESSPTPEARAKNVPASRPHKIWTDDNLSSVRTSADKYEDQKQAEAEAATNSATANVEAKAKPPEPVIGAASAFAAPKSPEDAQRMIEWEDRDIDAQQEFLDKLRDQRREATTTEERARLEKLIQERIDIIAQTKKEREALVAQKKEMQEKPVTSPKTDTSGPTN